MLRQIGKFAKNRQGAFAMQFALMAVPLCVCTGLAIDGGRAFLARFELGSALDAAALAIGSTLNEDADLDAVARKFVEMNFKTAHDDPINLELVEIGGEDDALMLRGSVDINTFFMPLVGQPYVTVNAESEVRRGGSNVEVTLALDVTGSMNTTRINGLKAASKILIDEVVSTAQEPFFSKVAVVPWSASVHIDDDHIAASALAELRGEIRGSTSISNVSWRNGSTTTKTIESAGWRTNSGKSTTNATWKNGAARAISAITKTNSNSRIRVRLSSNPSYSNGDTVVITGAGGSYDFLNGNKYKVADRTTSSPYYIWLQNLGTSTYTSPPSGSTDSTSGSSQRCLYTNCEMRITASSHGFATGDLVYINNVGMSGTGETVNNTWGETWTITYRDGNNFSLNGTDGPTFRDFSSNGTSSECYVADCRYRVITTANHDFSESDRLFFWGISKSGSGTPLNTPVGSTITIDDPSGDTFFLKGDSRDYETWTSAGSVAECANTDCTITVTSTNHGLSTGEKVEITNVNGLTGINYGTSGGLRRYWVVTRTSSNAFTLDGSSPSLNNVSSSFSGSATAQCLAYGCDKLWYREGYNHYEASDCLVERPGAQAYTDASPSTAGIGISYTSNGACTTTNYVTPLTSNKTRLNAAIDDLSTGGNTAGQLGAAWSWYMISPNFADIWDKEVENKPLNYDHEDLIKVAVLMTDGEFNSATCYGVVTGSAGSTWNAQCDGKDAFAQAEAICTNMKAQGVTVYTVGLAINTALYADDFLINCASNPQYAHLASDEEALKSAFKKIAQSISRLRLSK